MSYVTLDIETAALEIKDKAILDYLISRQFAVSLHPAFSKIIMIGMKEDGGEPFCLYGDDEKELLEDFWSYLYRKKPEKIVTFNGYGFDVPFIYVRSLINGIKRQPCYEINQNKWSMERSNHYDCMLALSGANSFHYVSLDVLCRLLGIEVPEDRLTPKEKAKLYNDQEWEPIVEYNREDVILTEKLYERIKV
ncbi:MAG: ribonuclease H-like domain-containing protein [Candidatus Hydrothermarchaeales archaeon]